MQNKRRIPEQFSVSHPHTLKKPYISFFAPGVNNGASLYLTLDDCKYWLGDDRECPQEILDKYLPYMTWEFSRFEDEEIEIEQTVDVKGKEVVKKEKKVISVDKNKPTTENLLAAKQEIMSSINIQNVSSSDELKAVQQEINKRLVPSFGEHPAAKAFAEEKLGADDLARVLKKLAVNL